MASTVTVLTGFHCSIITLLQVYIKFTHNLFTPYLHDVFSRLHEVYPRFIYMLFRWFVKSIYMQFTRRNTVNFQFSINLPYVMIE